MIVSKKTEDWGNLEGLWSRLSGPSRNLKEYELRISGTYYSSSYSYSYLVNCYWHRLYGRSFKETWDINDKAFGKFKEV